MAYLSFTNIILAVGLSYFLFTAWSFYEVFFPKQCLGPKTACIDPEWTPADRLSLHVEVVKGKSSAKQWLKTYRFSLDGGVSAKFSVTPPTEAFHNKTVEVLVSLRDKSGPVFTKRVPITTHKEAVRTAYNLLGGNNQSDASLNSSKLPVESNGEAPVNYWLTHLRVYILETPVTFDRNTVAPELIPHLRVSMDRDTQHMKYHHVILIDPLLQPSADWVEVPAIANQSSLPKMDFMMSVEPQSIGRFRLRSMFGMMTEQLRSYGFKQKDVDDVRQLFLGTNFYFLVTTMFVAVFHMVFDFLAFKNDISFWRNAKSTTGLSMRTVVWRFFSSVIIFLHLLEERSSLLVTIPMGISAVIELWKLGRLTKCSFSFKRGFQLGKRSKEEQETDQLDAQFMFWLQLLMLPLCLAGAVYSLLYTPHRSWYSWCLQTLVHGVYAFGFLFMTPQLFINYRLKSVAHLPWKALTYKAFNTFIDDFFAMIISMPTSHRIACLRDDVIFLIYLYQRWLYPVDKSRVNEFGQRGDSEGDAEEKPKEITTEENGHTEEEDNAEESSKKDN